MGMRYVDRGPVSAQKNMYFPREDNDKCVEILREWRLKRIEALKEGRPDKCPIPAFVAASIQKICENVSFRYNFRDHHYREDMVGEAVYNMLRYLHSFNPDKIGERSKRVNFYGWVTRCADTSFGGTILHEKEQEYFKNALFCNAGGFAAFSEEVDAMGDQQLTSEMANDITSRARDYELRREERKKKQKDKEDERLREAQEVQGEENKGVLRFIKTK